MKLIKQHVEHVSIFVRLVRVLHSAHLALVDTMMQLHLVSHAHQIVFLVQEHQHVQNVNLIIKLMAESANH